MEPDNTYIGGQGSGFVGNATITLSNESSFQTGFTIVGGNGLTALFSIEGSSTTYMAGLTLQAGGTIQVGTNGSASGVFLNMSQGSTIVRDLSSNSGQLSFQQLVTLAGTLDVTLDPGFDPTLGETFDLITFGSETGAFSTIDLPPLDPGLAWNTQQLYINGEISVVSAVPEPAAFGLIGVGALWPLSRRRGRKGPRAWLSA